MQLDKKRRPHQSLGSRILGKQDPMTPLIDLWNALADGRTGSHVCDEIRARTDPALWAYQANARRDLFEDIITQALSDGVLDDDELAFLRGCTATLGIETEDADSVYRKCALSVYRRELERIAADDARWRADSPEVVRARQQLRIGSSDASKIESMVGIATTEALIEQFASDGEIDDTETRIIEQALDDRGIGLEHLDVSVIDLIQESRERFRLSRDPLQRIDTRELGVRVRDETCFCVADASWYEYRRDRGQLYMSMIANGMLLITEEGVRLLGMGSSKACLWKSVASLDVLDLDTFRLQRTSGKSPEIRITNPVLPLLRGAPGIIADRLFHES